MTTGRSTEAASAVFGGCENGARHLEVALVDRLEQAADATVDAHRGGVGELGHPSRGRLGGAVLAQRAQAGRDERLIF